MPIVLVNSSGSLRKPAHCRRDVRAVALSNGAVNTLGGMIDCAPDVRLIPWGIPPHRCQAGWRRLSGAPARSRLHLFGGPRQRKGFVLEVGGNPAIDDRDGDELLISLFDVESFLVTKSSPL